MKCEFSETQFLFAITRELSNKYHTIGKGWLAPTFPTQPEEKRLGYDASIKGPVRTLYFQFKVPERISGHRGLYLKEFGGPYYKFKITLNTISPQHNTLVDLANRDNRYKVYYCSPAFHTNGEYQKYYKEEKISKNSIYVPCGLLPKISGNDLHDVSYIIEPERRYVMHSDPLNIQAQNVDEMIMDLSESKPYDNINECLTSIEEGFSIIRDNNMTEAERIRNIGACLLSKYDLYLTLITDR